MSLALIRAQYKAILETVAGIGVVHDYARLAVDWAKFLELYKDPATEKILGWDISRESSPATKYIIGGASPNARADRSHVFLIRGYAGLQDSTGSEKTFQDLVDAVLDKFLPLATLNGAALAADPMVLTLVGERMFGSALCHYCEIRQNVRERITY